MINIGYLYYKEYFSGLKININDNGEPKLDGNATLGKLKRIKLKDYKETAKSLENPYAENKPLKLETTYPGLLVGSGYIHGIGSNQKDPSTNNKEYLVKNELRLGFFFDHTTGLPVIPASSVKGLLRSAFKKAIDKDDKGNKASLYVKELLDSITKKTWSIDVISKLEKSIFDGEKDTSIYQRDIFFDVYPVSSKNSQLFSNDYITHHENPLKNPNPVQFFKILPQVEFQFNFKLQNFKDKNDADYLSAEDKKELFKQILLDLGIGAKTNVGYGQFIYKKPPMVRLKESITSSQKATLMANVNKEYNAVIVNINEDDYLFKLIDFNDCKIRKSILAVTNKFNKDAEKRVKRSKSSVYKEMKVGLELKLRINRQIGVSSDLNFTVLPIWE